MLGVIAPAEMELSHESKHRRAIPQHAFRLHRHWHEESLGLFVPVFLIHSQIKDPTALMFQISNTSGKNMARDFGA